jgi:predicted ATP-binding protein involved in virulence
MHLHPQWQRQIIKSLTEAFPNCQFVLTTHSPLVISDQPDVRVLLLSEGGPKPLPNLYGQDANTVLLEALDTDIRNQEIQKQLNKLFDALSFGKLENAKALLQVLDNELPANHIELSKARLLLKRAEVKRAKN